MPGKCLGNYSVTPGVRMSPISNMNLVDQPGKNWLKKGQTSLWPKQSFSPHTLSLEPWPHKQSSLTDIVLAILSFCIYLSFFLLYYTSVWINIIYIVRFIAQFLSQFKLIVESNVINWIYTNYDKAEWYVVFIHRVGSTWLFVGSLPTSKMYCNALSVTPLYGKQIFYKW